jgi:hypothetical protein
MSDNQSFLNAIPLWDILKSDHDRPPLADEICRCEVVDIAPYEMIMMSLVEVKANCVELLEHRQVKNCLLTEH